MATRQQVETVAAFICEECCELKPIPEDLKGPCVECRAAKAEDDDAEFFNDAVSAAQDAFWAEVAKRYRAKGVTSGDFPPDAHMTFRTACTDAVGEWCAFNAGTVGPGESDDDDNDDGVPFRDKWDPEKAFPSAVERAAASHLAAGWRVTYDYPGYFAFTHKDRKNVMIIATPDFHEAGKIPVDVQDDEGQSLDPEEPDIDWPLADRLTDGKPDVARAAHRYLNLMSVVLARHSPKKLVVEFDVTGWNDAEIDNLMTEACAQAESSDEDSYHPHPDAKVLRSEVVPMESE